MAAHRPHETAADAAGSTGDAGTSELDSGPVTPTEA